MQRIAQVTDLHLDETYPQSIGVDTRQRWQRVVAELKKEQPDKVVCTGDIGEAGSLPWFYESLEGLPLRVVPGNHDTCANLARASSSGTRNCYFSEQISSFKAIYLDSSLGEIDTTQLAWLHQELRQPKPVLLFIHHPVLGLPLKVDDIGALANRDRVVKVLTAMENPVSVFCGHYHMDGILTHQNITQYITPAVSFQIDADPKEVIPNTSIFGYRIISLEGPTINTSLQQFYEAK